MSRIICGLGEDVKFEGVWFEAGSWKLVLTPHDTEDLLETIEKQR